MQFVAGSRIGARGLAWDLVEAQLCGAQQRLHLRCAGGDLRGLEWDILYPAEQVHVLQAELRPEAPAPLAVWRLHHIADLLEQLPGPDDMLATEPGRLTIEPYQLVPLMRALELPRPRLLLADGVGLGKTVQAGLIATELIARRRAHRILVVAPAGPLLVQWQQELRQRFGLHFIPITDSATLLRERRRIELGGNPFDSIALCLLALDFAKQERVLEELERAAWDLAIIDEAHHCIGGLLDTEATLRRRLAEVIARRSDGLLLLTATPHDGYDAHFASLLELLDPSLVDGRGGLVGSAYRRHVVRRLKSHIHNPTTGAPLFRQRRVLPVRIDCHPAAPVQAFHAALAALVAPRLRRAQHDTTYADALAFISLLKRSVSTIAACNATLRVVAERYRALQADGPDAETLRKERARALRAYRRRRLRFGVLDVTAEASAAELEVEEMAADLHRCGVPGGADQPSATPQQDGMVETLRRLTQLGSAAEAHDPKLAALCAEVRCIRAAHPTANILIYTEYADSQLAAMQALRRDPHIQGDVLAISGLDAEAERIRIAEQFAEQDGLVLLSTDSMAEGLNLQRRCWHLLHLDLPYNPNRLEQRNGRIDRYGQAHDPEIRYLYLAGTFEEHLLLRLIAKYEKARACLDVMPDTLGVTADEADWNQGLVAGFAEAQAGLFDDDAPVIRTLDRAAEISDAAALHDLLHEIDRAFAGYEQYAVRHGWMAAQGLNADQRQVRQADSARQRGDTLTGHIDLADFVARAIALTRHDERAAFPAPCCHHGKCGGYAVPVTAPDTELHIPAEWTAGLDSLPGYNPATRTLRITRNRDRLRDSEGHPLAFLGRAHPLTRRAIARVRQNELADTSGIHDTRVSAARAVRGTPPAVLLTYAIEIASLRGVERQRIIAVLLPKHGPATAMQRPDQWLPLASPDRAIAGDALWQRQFAAWVPRRRPQADKLAASLMHSIAAGLSEVRQREAHREIAERDRWLSVRADDICGVFHSLTADLFGLEPDLPAWKQFPAPLDRLAAFAADAGNAPARRREANSVIALFQRYSDERTSRLTLSPPRLQLRGLLMLLPDGARA